MLSYLAIVFALVIGLTFVAIPTKLVTTKEGFVEYILYGPGLGWRRHFGWGGYGGWRGCGGRFGCRCPMCRRRWSQYYA